MKLKLLVAMSFLCAIPSAWAELVVYVVTTDPVDTHVQLIRGDRVIAEGDTVSREIRFEVDDSAGRPTATAPGFRERPAIQDVASRFGKAPPVVKISLSETFAARQERVAAEAKNRREAYLAAHADLTVEKRAAIKDGRLLTGMDMPDTIATIGRLNRESSSGGAGGEVDVWSSTVDGDITYLYFVAGRLARWEHIDNHPSL